MAALRSTIVSQDYADYIVEYGGIGAYIYEIYTRQTVCRSLMSGTGRSIFL